MRMDDKGRRFGTVLCLPLLCCLFPVLCVCCLFFAPQIRFLFPTAAALLLLNLICAVCLAAAEEREGLLVSAMLLVRSSSPAAYLGSVAAFLLFLIIVALGGPMAADGRSAEQLLLLPIFNFLLFWCVGLFYTLPLIRRAGRRGMLSPFRATLLTVLGLIPAADIACAIWLAVKCYRRGRAALIWMLIQAVPLVAPFVKSPFWGGFF